MVRNAQIRKGEDVELKLYAKMPNLSIHVLLIGMKTSAFGIKTIARYWNAKTLLEAPSQNVI